MQEAGAAAARLTADLTVLPHSTMGMSVEEDMIARAVGVGMLVIGMAGPALAQQASPSEQRGRQQIEAFMQKWMDAYNRGDAQTFSSLIAADSFAVGDRGVLSGNDRVARVMQNEATLGGKVTNFTVDQVRMLGRNAAVATGPYAVTYSKPRPLTIQGTWMQVLERQRGAWKSIAASYTPMTAPRAAPETGASTAEPSSGSSTR
ncbi:MAG TPA: nuclear transport factor 2 family protein [Stellaceae bacterium]|nr:nuclear transport factor 2 family protein [Stellaceae bacterium]